MQSSSLAKLSFIIIVGCFFDVKFCSIPPEIVQLTKQLLDVTKTNIQLLFSRILPNHCSDE